MEDNKVGEGYYVPDKEDLFIGYEYEERNLDGKSYSKTRILSFYDMLYNIEPCIGTIRTRYLCREDIESLRWSDFHEVPRWDEAQVVMYAATKDNMMMVIDTEAHTIAISPKDPTRSVDGKRDAYDYPPKVGMFRGYCKSINELRKIMQYLSIPIPETTTSPST